MLSETRLATSMRTRDITDLSALGKVIQMQPGDIIYRQSDPARALYVILKGDVQFSLGNDNAPSNWIGQGDVFGEIGFLLGGRRRQTARAGAVGCTLWKLPRKLIFRERSANGLTLLTLLMISLEPIIKIRQAKLSLKRANQPEIFCDHHHHAIQRVAAFLRRQDPWETAIAIWHFVRNMPYRFGSWNLTASETLQLGFGMCTTKANLQTALLRACHLQAGFTELIVPSKFVASLLPTGYRNRISGSIKHYFSVVFLDGKWYPCDASFTRESLVLMSDQNPEVISCIDDVFTARLPFNPVGEKNGLDPFDFPPLLDIDHIFRKIPFFDDDHFESMNILLDRLQNPVLGIPGWVRQARKQIKNNPEHAFRVAYTGMISDTYKLAKILRKRLRRGEVADSKTKIQVTKQS